MQKKILIVDDEAEIAETIGEVLQAAGYDTASAANGLEALERLRTGPHPDLILLDLSMPVLDGWGFRREQQAMPDLAAIPVVVVTADGDARRKATSLQADGFLRKPCSIRALLDEIERHLPPPGGGSMDLGKASGA